MVTKDGERRALVEETKSFGIRARCTQEILEDTAQETAVLLVAVSRRDLLVAAGSLSIAALLVRLTDANLLGVRGGAVGVGKGHGGGGEGSGNSEELHFDSWD